MKGLISQSTGIRYLSLSKATNDITRIVESSRIVITIRQIAFSVLFIRAFCVIFSSSLLKNINICKKYIRYVIMTITNIVKHIFK